MLAEMIQRAMDNDEPIRFSVLYDDDVIGTLFIKENQHKYVPDKEVIRKVEKKIFILKELTEPQDWGRPIYYLQRLIDNTIRFPGRGWIGYHTSHISLEISLSRK